jgi:hypothetical protein
MEISFSDFLVVKYLEVTEMHDFSGKFGVKIIKGKEIFMAEA